MDLAWQGYQEWNHLNNSIDMEYAILNLRKTEELYFYRYYSFEKGEISTKGKAYGFNIKDSLEDEVTYIREVSEEISRKQSKDKSRKSSDYLLLN